MGDTKLILDNDDFSNMASVTAAKWRWTDANGTQTATFASYSNGAAIVEVDFGATILLPGTLTATAADAVTWADGGTIAAPLSWPAT